MTRAVSHRGPDGEGFFQREGIAFGHRRLAIIDLEAGKQPMGNEDGTVWVTYNGEIYNYRELRAELEAKGHVFATRSDTEVIVHGWEEWGETCVQRFRGMFAFGLADFEKQQLFLARDHFGIKPHYYRLGPGYLAFASELTALRQVDAPVPGGNLLAVELFLRFQYIPTPHTIYNDTFKLPPASTMLVRFDGTRGEPRRYWDLNFESQPRLSDGEWEERAAAVIRDSVKAHLVADVPFGVFLSGGIDSTLVAGEMSKLLERPVEAFSIGFDESEFSELPHAQEAAKRIGVKLHTEIVRSDSLDMLGDLVAHYGEPFGDSSSIPTWHVSRLARSQVPMVLSGDGGDEGFGGYSSYVSWMQGHEYTLAHLRQLLGGPPRPALGLIKRWLRRSVGAGQPHNLDHWQAHILYMREEQRRQMWRDEFHHLLAEPSAVFSHAHEKMQRRERLDYAQYLDYQTYLPCDILTKVDVASMYHGLEVRPPLIDVKVLELAASLPPGQRYRRDAHGNPVGKDILKRLLGRTFPPDFVHRKKQGFSIPRVFWFLPGHAGRKLLEQVVLDQGSRLRQWFNPAALQATIEDHSREHDISHVLWLLLVLGMWLEQNPEVTFSHPSNATDSAAIASAAAAYRA